MRIIAPRSHSSFAERPPRVRGLRISTSPAAMPCMTGLQRIDRSRYQYPGLRASCRIPHHAPTLELLRTLVEGDQPWAIPPFVLIEFVGIVTYRRYNPPIGIEAAFDRIEGLREYQLLQILMPGVRFHSLYSRLSLEAKASGSLTYAAAIVALCLEHGVSRLVTEDRDCRRFGKELKIVSLPA